MEAKVFLFDSDGSFCTTTLNRFFDITDRQVAAIANSEVIISGERVRVTKIMAFTESWLEFSYTVPIVALRDIVNGLRPELSWSFWTAMCSLRKEKCLSCHLMVGAFILILAMLIGYSVCYSLSWIAANLGPITVLVLALGLSLFWIISMWTVVCRPTCAGRMCWWSLVAWSGALVLTLFGTGIVFIWPSMNAVESLWSDFWWTHDQDLREKIEKSFTCCGWNGTESHPREECLSRLGVSEAPFCKDAIRDQLKAFDIGVMVGFCVLLVLLILLVIILVVDMCKLKDMIYREQIR
jgi:hypothetical protein